jgi:RNA polymerase sigma-70 factor (ECF subfamily)
MAAASDGELLASLVEGDEAALVRLYEAYAPSVMGIAYNILRSRPEAEEVVQEVFCRLWTRGVTYDAARGRFATWLFVVARNVALDRRRASVRRFEVLDSAANEPDVERHDDPESSAFLGEVRRNVAGALASLSATERDTIELAFYRGLSQSEIADRIGEPLGTVKSRMRRATEKLRTVLAAGGYGT